MTFVKVALKKDLEPNKMIGAEVDDRKIVVVNVEGKFNAIGNRCTHMGCLLSDGTLRGGNITCSCHGSIFDVTTGNVIKGPAMKPEPAYELKIEGEQILADV